MGDSRLRIRECEERLAMEWRVGVEAEDDVEGGAFSPLVLVLGVDNVESEWREPRLSDRRRVAVSPRLSIPLCTGGMGDNTES